MINHQLYLIIGVPSCISLLTAVTAILACLSHTQAMRRIGDKIDKFIESLRADRETYLASRKITAEF